MQKSLKCAGSGSSPTGSRRSVVDQHRDAIVCHGEVGPAIAVEVPDSHRVGKCAYSKETLGLKPAVPVAQEDGHVLEIPVGHGEVRKAVAVEVSHRDENRLGADTEVLPRPES